jgi:hypothetical protein
LVQLVFVKIADKLLEQGMNIIFLIVLIKNAVDIYMCLWRGSLISTQACVWVKLVKDLREKIWPFNISNSWFRCGEVAEIEINVNLLFKR